MWCLRCQERIKPFLWCGKQEQLSRVIGRTPLSSGVRRLRPRVEIQASQSFAARRKGRPS
jgi:hypothetical protein